MGTIRLDSDIEKSKGGVDRFWFVFNKVKDKNSINCKYKFIFILKCRF